MRAPGLEIHPLSHGQQLLKMPLTERPVCPFETTEYNAVVTDVMQRTQSDAKHGYGLHLAHQIALMTVMVSRAARALTIAPLTEKLVQTGENYHASYERPSAALQAYERLARELRRWIVLIDPAFGAYRVSLETEREHLRRRQHDTAVDPDSLAKLDGFRPTSTPKPQTAETAKEIAKHADEHQAGGRASSRAIDAPANSNPSHDSPPVIHNSPLVILSEREESPPRNGQVSTEREQNSASSEWTARGEADETPPGVNASAANPRPDP
jgi:hypothetical protein